MLYINFLNSMLTITIVVFENDINTLYNGHNAKVHSPPDWRISTCCTYNFGSRTGRNVFIYCVLCIVHQSWICSRLGYVYVIERNLYIKKKENISIKINVHIKSILKPKLLTFNIKNLFFICYLTIDQWPYINSFSNVILTSCVVQIISLDGRDH